VEIIYLEIVSCQNFIPFNELIFVGFKTNKAYRKFVILHYFGHADLCNNQ
jgi:Zn-dependent peptidase ImmA (M78 family)